MPSIKPLGTVPLTPPAKVSPDSILQLSPGETLWVEGRVSSGSVALRPYYFAVGGSTLLGGAYVPLGSDAVAGNPVSFNIADYNGCASGTYDWRRTQAYFVLVMESNMGAVFDFVNLSTELATSPT